MKKLVVVLVALAMVVSMSGLAFAYEGRGDLIDLFKSGAKINSDILKDICFDNNTEAYTGNAEAKGNFSNSQVKTNNEAKANECSEVINDNPIVVDNQGGATALTKPATATQNAQNCEQEDIVDTADTNANVDVYVDDIPPFIPWVSDASLNEVDGGHDFSWLADIFDCCPAQIFGDICIKVKFDNGTYAYTGDATAFGNHAITHIDAKNKAEACDGSEAANENPITVTNYGQADATTGEAVATNNAENCVNINIQRSATADKTINICADFSECYAVN
ncbi:MAG: hypothetical protein K6T91_08320 [Firmicutes bacterium]|nr:hypothetical protein [Bacillota bacterium]